MPPQAPPRGKEGRDAERGPADAQHDDNDVPQGTLEIQEGEIEAVESLVEPAAEPAHADRSLDDAAPLRIEIEPRAVLVGVPHAKDRQRSGASRIVVVAVI